MLHGRVVRPAVVNSKPTSVDESSIAHIPGIVKVVQEGNFVGVVAQTEWGAIQAAKALKVTWSTPGTKLPANRAELDDYLTKYEKFSRAPRGQQGKSRRRRLSQASKTFEATYRWPFQLHGMIGPSCAVADVNGDKVTIWAGSQGTFNTRKQVADMLGLPEKNVRVIYRESAGCYGRLSPDDVPQDAALMSRAVGKPVRVQWSREDEHGWEPKGPAQLMTAKAGVDAQGNLVAWDFLDRSFPWTTTGMVLLASRQIGMKPKAQGNPNGTDGGGEIYSIDNQRVVAAAIPWLHAGSDTAADQQSARAGRSGPLFCQRILHRRSCRGRRRRPREIPAEVSGWQQAHHRRAAGRNAKIRMARAAVTRGQVDRTDRNRARRGRGESLQYHDRRGGGSGSRQAHREK